ncbi:MAG: triose-phosphate isomerase, partial [Clostridia bacterium]|nr:triose-phosphate isomerase [Clostridia bacterium]
GKTATADDANKTIGYIRSLIKKNFGLEIGKNLRNQYGGSMKPSNAKELMAKNNIDGGLIGGAALKAQDFANIVNYRNL